MKAIAWSLGDGVVGYGAARCSNEVCSSSERRTGTNITSYVREGRIGTTALRIKLHDATSDHCQAASLARRGRSTAVHTLQRAGQQTRTLVGQQRHRGGWLSANGDLCVGYKSHESQWARPFESMEKTACTRSQYLDLVGLAKAGGVQAGEGLVCSLKRTRNPEVIQENAGETAG